MAALDAQRPAIEVVRLWFGLLIDWIDPGEPRRFPGPFTRWPTASDAALVAAVLLISVITVGVSERPEGDALTLGAFTERPIGSFLILAAMAAALWWRRTSPDTVTTVILGLMVIWSVGDFGDGHQAALVVALYSVGRHGHDRRLGLLAVAAAIVVNIAGALIDTNQGIDALQAILLAVVPWYVGRQFRNRAETLTLLEKRAVADERAQVARELHNVVAHRVSMMTAQASTAKAAAPRDLGAAVDAMDDVEQTGRATLGELRQMQGVLRTTTRSTNGDTPGLQPGVDAIPALVDGLMDTGADVGLTIEPLPHWLPTSVDLSAYRIVQESIANIVKHAGPRPVVDIELFVEGPDLVVDITNTVDATAPALPGSGYGIIGMRERASLLGGTLDAGREPPSQYRVHARLPLLDSDPA
ncbi:MAG: histidine kinase [Actinomycetota bacterium]